MTPADQIAEDECRKAFEAWADDPKFPGKAIERNKDGRYKLMQAACDWRAWQAAWSAHDLSVAGEAVAWATDKGGITDSRFKAQCWKDEGHILTPLYAQPQAGQRAGVDVEALKREVSGRFPMMTAAEAIDYLASRNLLATAPAQGDEG